MEVRPLLVLGVAVLLCAVLMLTAFQIPELIGRPLWDVAGIGLVVSVTALITVVAIAGVTELTTFMRRERISQVRRDDANE